MVNDFKTEGSLKMEESQIVATDVYIDWIPASAYTVVY